MYTVDHIFGYRSQTLIRACVKSSAHAHGTEIRGGNLKNFWKQSRDAQGNGWFATDSQGRIWTLDSDSRTGTFHQMRVSVSDTSCNVNGVLV